ncbi:hypothetical protein [Geosporobacter ferrireducens]|uniref:Uncharacterized protein n=1 Tax=Geosporobacter ferrireducens TaxID=1424294 RepID=A0A1D8GN08_9FIRM|nr:hypothetical protein [Geosporobacter ferrireducens]AOT72311.1 hypothetical protein Gferi_23840 [Geosporobacter ferrireducens]MTI56262.1 hypothetical protein [Geosporobacter ferrireducens]
MSRITFYTTTSNYSISNLTDSKINTVKENGSNNIHNDELFISDESIKMCLALKGYDSDSPLKFDEQFLNKDYYEQRKLDFAKSISEKQDIDPLENEFQILGVKYIFQAGTLEHFLTEKLEGKTKNASLIANEIAEKIRGTVSNPNATIEERAMNRKTALKLAEHIAQNYFDNDDEANEFLSEINKYAENDVLREKGYVVFDNSDMKPFKAYTMPTAPEGYISASALAEKYGDTSFKEIFNDRVKLEDFLKALHKNGEKWRAEIVKDFDENEQRVQNIIDKSSLSQLNEQYVQNIINKFFG